MTALAINVRERDRAMAYPAVLTGKYLFHAVRLATRFDRKYFGVA